MFETLITCHDCKSQLSYHVTEWPPKVIVCNECGATFGFNQDLTFNLINYCRINQ